jgi:NAD(P)-dependent dehydrogenase (short-subunit alcohol dehydrogenase family)
MTSTNNDKQRQALLFGGTGSVGKAVLRMLVDAGVSTVFTYFKSEALARELQSEYGCSALEVDLSDPQQTRRLMRTLANDGIEPDIFIHCAAESQNLPLCGITDADWDNMQRLSCQSAFIACQALEKSMSAKQNGDIVLLGALDKTQSIKLPVHFAAVQGMLAALTMALAKSLGPSGIRVNLITVGLLNEGLSAHFDQQLHRQFTTHSALGRRGAPEEVAHVVEWLALRNSYISGKIIPVNGGI